MTDEAARSGITEHTINFRGRKPRVDGNRRYPEPGTRVYQLQIFGLIRQEQCQTIPSPEAVLTECGGNARNTAMQLPKGAPFGTYHERSRACVVPNGSAEGVSMDHLAISGGSGTAEAQQPHQQLVLFASELLH